MTHFGIICPTSPGHLNPMTALGRELKRRGHRYHNNPNSRRPSLGTGCGVGVPGDWRKRADRWGTSETICPTRSVEWASCYQVYSEFD